MFENGSVDTVAEASSETINAENLREQPYFINTEIDGDAPAVLHPTPLGTYTVCQLDEGHFCLTIRVMPSERNQWSPFESTRFKFIDDDDKPTHKIKTMPYSAAKHIRSRSFDSMSAFLFYELHVRREHLGLAYQPYDPATLRPAWTIQDIIESQFGDTSRNAKEHLYRNFKSIEILLLKKPIGTCIVKPSMSDDGVWVFAFVNKARKISQQRFVLCSREYHIYLLGGAPVNSLPYHGEPPESLSPQPHASVLKGIKRGLFFEPVEAPCGHFFEKAQLERHLQRRKEIFAHLAEEQDPTCPDCDEPGLEQSQGATEHVRAQNLKQACDQWRLKHLDENALEHDDAFTTFASMLRALAKSHLKKGTTFQYFGVQVRNRELNCPS